MLVGTELPREPPPDGQVLVGLRDDVPHRAAHPTDDWVQPDAGEPQIQPMPGLVELVPPYEDIYFTPRGPHLRTTITAAWNNLVAARQLASATTKGSSICSTNRPSVAAESRSVQPKRNTNRSCTRQKGASEERETKTTQAYTQRFYTKSCRCCQTYNYFSDNSLPASCCGAI